MAKKQRKKKSIKAGLPPGSLIRIGEARTEPILLSIYKYNAHSFFESLKFKSCGEIPPLEEGFITWLEVDGVHDMKIIETIGKQFDIHPLILEDIVSTDQRPKREDYKDSLFLTLKMVQNTKEGLVTEQVSFILKKNVLISFQENCADVFETVRNRLRSGKGKIRNCSADYLLYALVDAIVDNYFVVFEELGERLDLLEEEVVQNPSPETLERIYETKHTIIALRRVIWPLREVINALIRGEVPQISNDALIYFRDVYDHVVELIDILENAREMTASMLDVYLSSMSNKLNEVMRVLTVITTIFMPLTFIVGLYGMNFHFMPELSWRYGYFYVLGLMGFITLGMFYFFRKREWL